MTVIYYYLEIANYYVLKFHVIVNNFISKENNSDTKEYVPSIKGDVIDFCIGGATIKVILQKKTKLFLRN